MFIILLLLTVVCIRLTLVCGHLLNKDVNIEPNSTWTTRILHLLLTAFAFSKHVDWAHYILSFSPFLRCLARTTIPVLDKLLLYSFLPSSDQFFLVFHSWCYFSAFDQSLVYLHNMYLYSYPILSCWLFFLSHTDSLTVCHAHHTHDDKVFRALRAVSS